MDNAISSNRIGDDVSNNKDGLCAPGIMRSAILRTYFIYSGLILMASTYSNWQPLFSILNSMGAYTSICDEASSHEMSSATCDEQYKYLTQIFVTSNNFAYIVSALAGVLIDTVGGQSTSAAGVFFIFLGWMLIRFSTEDRPYYWPGMLSLGTAENLVGFPGLLPDRFWPSQPGLFSSLSVAMQQLSGFIPAIIWKLSGYSWSPLSTEGYISLYLGIIIIPSALMVGSMPDRKFDWTPYEERDKKQMDGQYDPLNGLPCCGYNIGPFPIKDRPNQVTGCVSARMKAGIDWNQQWQEFKFCCSFPQFSEFTVWYSCLTLGFQLYNARILEHADEDVGELVGNMVPLTAICGPLMGIISDSFGLFPMAIANNLFLILAFVFALVPMTGAQYTSVVFYSMGRSFCFSCKYIFVHSFFPSQHFGKLSGLISCIGGILGLVNVFLQYTHITIESEYAICALMACIIIIIPFRFQWKYRKCKILRIPLVGPNGPWTDNNTYFDLQEKCQPTGQRDS